MAIKETNYLIHVVINQLSTENEYVLDQKSGFKCQRVLSFKGQNLWPKRSSNFSFDKLVFGGARWHGQSLELLPQLS